MTTLTAAGRTSVPETRLHRPDFAGPVADEGLAIRSVREEPEPGPLFDIFDRHKVRAMVVNMTDLARAIALHPCGRCRWISVRADCVWLLEDKGQRVDARRALVDQDLEEGIRDLDLQLVGITDRELRR